MINRYFYLQQVTLSVICLFAIIVLFDVTGIDMALQNLFFQFDSGTWLVDKHDAVLKLIFYDGAKKLIVLLDLAILVALVFFRKLDLVKKYRQGLLTVLISTVITVALVGALKGLTNVPCPKDLSHFSGDHPYVTMLHRVVEAAGMDRVRCFPAGHASGGFALLSLFFLFRRRRNRLIAFGVAMALGWILGLYKMLIGDHFLSHTLVTMCLAWLVSVLVAAKVFGLSPKKGAAQQPAREKLAASPVAAGGGAAAS